MIKVCLGFTFIETLLPAAHKSRDSSIKYVRIYLVCLASSLNISVSDLKVSISKYNVLYFVDIICKQSICCFLSWKKLFHPIWLLLLKLYLKAVFKQFCNCCCFITKQLKKYTLYIIDFLFKNWILFLVWFFRVLFLVRYLIVWPWV